MFLPYLIAPGKKDGIADLVFILTVNILLALGLDELIVHMVIPKNILLLSYECERSHVIFSLASNISKKPIRISLCF